MEDLVVRPSLKRGKMSALLAMVILFGVVYGWWRFQEHVAWWVIFIGVIPFLAPLLSWIDYRRTCLTLSGRILSYHTGFIATSTQRLDVAKVQNVRVERSLVERMWGVGTVIIETASESGRLVVHHIDGPTAVADRILEASSKAASVQGDQVS